MVCPALAATADDSNVRIVAWVDDLRTEESD
jgi:hypothetical protein